MEEWKEEGGGKKEREGIRDGQERTEVKWGKEERGGGLEKKGRNRRGRWGVGGRGGGERWGDGGEEEEGRYGKGGDCGRGGGGGGKRMEKSKR